MTPYKNKSVPVNLTITNSKTPKENMPKKGVYGNSGIISSVGKSDDRLNLSVDIAASK